MQNKALWLTRAWHVAPFVFVLHSLNKTSVLGEAKSLLSLCLLWRKLLNRAEGNQSVLESTNSTELSLLWSICSPTLWNYYFKTSLSLKLSIHQLSHSQQMNLTLEREKQKPTDRNSLNSQIPHSKPTMICPCYNRREFLFLKLVIPLCSWIPLPSPSQENYSTLFSLVHSTQLQLHCVHLVSIYTHFNVTAFS